MLITGAGGQIGQGLLRAFLSQGATVVGVDLSPLPKSFKLSPALRKRFTFLRADITKAQEVRALRATAKRPIDVLVNCAGIGVYTPLEQRTEEELDQVLSVNLKGTILMSREFSKDMVKRKRGTIINFGSIYGITTPDFRIYGDSGRNSSEIYGATKAGVIHLTRYLAAYLARYGVTANAVSPGGVFRNQAAFFKKNYEYKTPLGRMADVSDLVGAVLFLASDDARYITGQNIAVDGGFTLW